MAWIEFAVREGIRELVITAIFMPTVLAESESLLHLAMP